MAQSPPEHESPDPRSSDIEDDPRPPWAVLHVWQIQWVRDLLVGLGLVVLVLVGHSARVVTEPFLLAVLFAYLMEPVVARLTRSDRISRKVAVSGILVALTVGVVLPLLFGVGFGTVQGTRLARDVARSAGAVIESVDDRENPELLEAVGTGAWRSIRDFIVEVRIEAESLESSKWNRHGWDPEAADDDASATEEGGGAAGAGDASSDEGEEASDDGNRPGTEAPTGAAVPEGTGPSSGDAPEADGDALLGESPIIHDIEAVSSILGIDSRDVARATDTVLEWVQSNARSIGGQAISTGAGAVNVALSTATSLGRLLFGAFLTAFFFFFVSAGWEGVKSFARGLLPVRNRERAVEITTKMDHAISGFIRGRLTIAFILAIFYTIGFALIGVPAPLIMGPCLAFLAIIPYATLLGLPFVVLLLWLEAHTGIRGSLWWVLLAPVAVYQIGQALDDYALTPTIQGDATGLDTPTILFASVAGASLLGLFGMLVAIPLAACIKILVTEIFWPRFQAWAEGKERDFLPIEED